MQLTNHLYFRGYLLLHNLVDNHNMNVMTQQKKQSKYQTTIKKKEVDGSNHV